MPTPYIKKVAKKHRSSVSTMEKKWADAKAAAKRQGKADNYAYITSIFKTMANESVNIKFSDFLKS